MKLEMTKLCSYFHKMALTGNRFQFYGPNRGSNRESGTCKDGLGRCSPNVYPSEYWEPEPYKRKRIQCPECGRRVIARVSFCHDGCCIYYSLPRHKPKRWWKNGGESDKRLRKKKRVLKLKRKFGEI